MRPLRSEQEARAFVASRCSAHALDHLDLFVDCLRKEAKVQNLVSSATMNAIWLRHVADSAQLVDHVPRETGLWLDLGTGAGFPGVVLAIMHPYRKFALVESRNLRVQWLKTVIGRLDIANCHIIGRDVGKIDRFDVDVISARAFAPLDRLIALSARFSTATTRWVLPKGRSASQEVAMLPQALRSMFHVEQSITDPYAGIVVGFGRAEIGA